MNLKSLTSIVLLTLITCGCKVARQSTKMLMERPDFGIAAEAAPEWTRAALKETARLEYELERR